MFHTTVTAMTDDKISKDATVVELKKPKPSTRLALKTMVFRR